MLHFLHYFLRNLLCRLELCYANSSEGGDGDLVWTYFASSDEGTQEII
jgi:hypothetical protein